MQTKFSERFKMLRIEKGYSQKEIANLLGVTQSTISKWENRFQKTKFAMVLEIVGLFDVSIDFLLGLSDKRKFDKNQRR